MKITPLMKKIVVKCAELWTDEIEIDTNIFDDPYLEAATRAVEKRRNLEGFKLTIILECWEKKEVKKPDKHFCYNTYRVLVNAAMYEKAEILRNTFLKLNGVDLKFESLKGGDEEDNGNNNHNKVSGSNTTTTTGDEDIIPKPKSPFE